MNPVFRCFAVLAFSLALSMYQGTAQAQKKAAHECVRIIAIVATQPWLYNSFCGENINYVGRVTQDGTCNQAQGYSGITPRYGRRIHYPSKLCIEYQNSESQAASGYERCDASLITDCGSSGNTIVKAALQDPSSGSFVFLPSGSVTIIEGATGTFSVAFSVAPTRETRVSLTSSSSKVTISPSSLTFNRLNTAQNVTFTSPKDSDAEGESAVITLSVDDGGGILAPSATKTIEVSDSEKSIGAIRLAPPGSQTVSEGGTGTFGVALSVAPIGNATVSLTSSSSELTITPTSLTFTASNGTTGQIVAFTAARDDDIQNENATITLSVEGGILASDITKAIEVKDKPVGSIIVSPSQVQTIDEGASGSFEVTLSIAPKANDDVTVSLSSSNPEVTLSGSTLTFTDSNWNTAQRVTVSASDDDDTSDDTATITLSATGGIFASDVTKTITVIDDEKPEGSIVVSPSQEQTLAEGAFGAFSVALSTAPNADVTVSLTSSNSDVTLSSSSLTFTASNFDTAQNITVGTRHDEDANNEYSIITLSVVGGIIASNVTKTISVHDDETLSDAPAYTCIKARWTGVNPGFGSNAEIENHCDEDVRIKGRVSVGYYDHPVWRSYCAESAVIGTANPQNSGHLRPDVFFRGPATLCIEYADNATQRARGGYADCDTRMVNGCGTVENGINILPPPKIGNLVVSPSSTLSLDEEGDSGSFSVFLSTAPSMDTTVSIQSDNQDVIHSPEVLTFTPSNHSTAQSFTVSARGDEDDRNESASITISVLASGGFSAPSVARTVNVEDNDEVGFLLSPESLKVNEGGQVNLGVRPTIRPSTNITVTLTPSDSRLTLDTDSDTAGNQSTLIFHRWGQTNAWNRYRTVIVSAADDDDRNDESSAISITAVGGNYADKTARVPVAVTDDDAPQSPSGKIDLSPTGAQTIDEGASGNFDVSLSVAPNADVTVSLTSSNADVSLDPSSLTFTDSNWSTAQSIAFTAAQDDDAQGLSATITLSAAGGITAEDVTKTITVIDDEKPEGSIVVSPSQEQTLAEGTFGAFTVALSTAPNADVTVSLTSSNSDVTLSSSSLTFTASNFDTAQNITVGTRHDEDANNEYSIITLSVVGGIIASNVTKTISVHDDETLSDAPAYTCIKARWTGVNPGFGSNAEIENHCDEDVRIKGRVSVGYYDHPVWRSYCAESAVIGVANPQNSGHLRPDVFFRGPATLCIEYADNATQRARGGYADCDTRMVNGCGTVENGINILPPPKIGNLVVSPSSTLSLDEEGESGSFSVFLSTAPSMDTIVSIQSDNPDVVHAPRTILETLTFTPSNYSTAQSFIVLARGDEDDRNESANITISVLASGGFSAPSVARTVNVEDNDEVGFLLSPESLKVNEGGQVNLGVRPTIRPSTNITVSLTPSDSRLTLDTDPDTAGNQSTLIFHRWGQTNAWNRYRTVIVSAADDDDRDDESSAISITAVGGNYADKTASVPVAVTDDDALPPPSGTITLSPAGAQTIDEGASGNFDVSLSVAPNADVTVSLTSSNADVSLDPSSLTFTDADGTSAKRVAFSAGDDADTTDDSATVSLSAVGGITAEDVTKTITVIDDDKPAGSIVVSPSKAQTIAEGGSGSFEVSLSVLPNADVTISLTSSDTELTLSPTSLTFTESNATTAQEVSFRAAQDDDTTDDAPMITLSASGGIIASDVTKTIDIGDDDKPSAAITLSPDTAQTVEEGASGTFEVSLSAAPKGDVTVALTSSNPEVTMTPASLTFTESNATTAQEVTFLAARDDDGVDDTATITLSASGGIVASDVTKTIGVTDTTPSGTITLSPAAAQTIDEGASGTFEVSLSVTPTSKVTVSLTSSSSVVTLSPASLTFTESNAATPQEVTFGAAQDADGADDTATITLSASGGIVASDATKRIDITDDDNPSGEIVLSPAGAQTIVEGSSGQFQVSLSIFPKSDASVTLTSSNPELTMTPASLTFTASNATTAQQVSIRAAQDDDSTNEIATITLSASGGIDASDVTKTINITDNENPAGTIVIPSSGAQAIAEGAWGNFTVALSVAPRSDVVVTLTSSNPDVTLSPSSLTFTASNAMTAQGVSFFGGQDDDATDEMATISLSASGGIIASDVTMTINVSDDDDPPGTILLSPSGAQKIAEGASGAFTVALSTLPRSDVVVTLTSSNPDVRVIPEALTFTAEDGTTAQEVSLAVARDDDARSETATITLSAGDGIVAPDAMKTIGIADDDAPAGTILVDPAGDLSIVEEGRAGNLNVSLDVQPSEEVTIILSGSDSDITFSRGSLVFTESSWYVPQVVYVSAAADSDLDGDIETITLTATGGIDAQAVTKRIVIDDDDIPGAFSLSPPGIFNVVEGGRATLGVALAVKPSVARIEVALSKTNEGIALSRTSLVFTDTNWDRTQDVVVSASEDDDHYNGVDTVTLVATGGGNYDGTSADLPVAILDTIGGFVLPAETLVLRESGSPITFSVRLDSPPVNTTSVVVTLTGSRSAIDIEPDLLVFAASEWNTEKSVEIRPVSDSNRSDERVSVTLTAAGGNYTNVQSKVSVHVVDDTGSEQAPLPPVKSQALAIPPSTVQDAVAIRIHCLWSEPCDVVLDCTAQDDGSHFQATLPDPIPAWGTLTLTAKDIEDHTGGSWAGKGRLGCGLRSPGNISSQVWTSSGDGVLVNNSAFIRSYPEGDGYRADIESIPSPDGVDESNLRIRCSSTEGDCLDTRFSCYDDKGAKYEGVLGGVDYLTVRHLQSEALAALIGYRWKGLGLVCEVRSSASFTVQVLTRTGGGGALVNNSATGNP